MGKIEEGSFTQTKGTGGEFKDSFQEEVMLDLNLK